MAWTDRMKEARINAGLTQDKVAKAIGVAKSTYSSYEKGTYEPNMDMLSRIMELLNVDPNYLFQDEDRHYKDTRATNDEMENIIKKYRALDKHGKELVDLILNKEWERCSVAIIEEQPTVSMIVYVNPAAAGVPLYAEDDFERIEFPEKDVPNGADFGVRISGDSMSPTIKDRSIVWVRRTPEVCNGQVGVFMVNSTAVCKRYSKSEDKIVLLSDNPKYPCLEINEGDRFGVVGKVIGMTEEE